MFLHLSLDPTQYICTSVCRIRHFERIVGAQHQQGTCFRSNARRNRKAQGKKKEQKRKTKPSQHPGPTKRRHSVNNKQKKPAKSEKMKLHQLYNPAVKYNPSINAELPTTGVMTPSSPSAPTSFDRAAFGLAGDSFDASGGTNDASLQNFIRANTAGQLEEAASWLPPPLGTAADLGLVAADLAAGNYVGAIVSAIGLVPGAGDAVATALRAVMRGSKLAPKVMRELDQFINSPRVGEMVEWLKDQFPRYANQLEQGLSQLKRQVDPDMGGHTTRRSSGGSSRPSSTPNLKGGGGFGPKLGDDISPGRINVNSMSRGQAREWVDALETSITSRKNELDHYINRNTRTYGSSEPRNWASNARTEYERHQQRIVDEQQLLNNIRSNFGM
jgi:hypothetical protein